MNYNYDPAKKSRASREAWAKRRAEGRDKQPQELVARRVASTKANRLAARSKMSPEERRSAALEERRARASRSRAGWKTRRAHQGLDPDRRVPATRPVNLYAADVAALAALAKRPKDAVHRLVALAVEVGVLVVDGGEAAHGPQEPR